MTAFVLQGHIYNEKYRFFFLTSYVFFYRLSVIMAPFTISPHPPLLYPCGLPPKALLMQSEMSPEPPSGSPGANEDLPLTHYHRMSITKITVHLWQVVRRVIDFCTSVSELLRSEMFAFIGAGQNMTMTGELKKKSGLEALERPSSDGETKVVIELDDDERESSVIDLDEEEDDDDEARLSEWESDEETEEEEEDDCEPEEEDTEWSDEDDEGDSEASAESLELWESFLSSGDPYNPLSFCSSIGSRTNSKQNLQPPPPPATRPEECESNPDSKEGGKKVNMFACFHIIFPLLLSND